MEPETNPKQRLGFGFPVFRTSTPTSRSLGAFVLVLFFAAGTGSAPAAAQPLVEARRLFLEGRATAAVPLLAQEFTADPDSADARRLLWEMARGAAPRPDLMDTLALAADRLGREGWLAAGVLLRRGLRPLDALDAFDRAAAGRPVEDPAADIEAGRLLAELHSHDLALARFERHRRNPEAIHGRAVVLARVRRTEEALALADELLRMGPEIPAAVLLHAELLDSMGRGSEALGPLRRLAESTAPDGPAAFRLARILVQQRVFGEAAPILRAILAAHATNGEAWLAMARVHQGEGRRDEAAAAFERALDEDPTLNEARFGLAQLLTREGNHEAAAPLFAAFERRKAVEDESGRLLGEAELYPQDNRRIEAFVNHALANGDFGLALRGAQRFLVEFPEIPERHLLLARVFREGGSRADAERVLRRGLARFAGNEDAERRLRAGLEAIGVR
jgi:tetratricopeptide (TPR) repeat protein